MRSSFVRVAIAAAATLAVAALWIVPSHAQKVPGTLDRPGMSDARVWVNNKGHNEAIPVTLMGGDGTPVIVSVSGVVDARTTTGRQAWDYRSVTVNADRDPAAAVTVLGNDGWEAVGMTAQTGGNITVLLKRPRY